MEAFWAAYSVVIVFFVLWFLAITILLPYYVWRIARNTEQMKRDIRRLADEAEDITRS